MSTDQKKILAEFQSFYTKLFQIDDSNLEKIDLEDVLRHCQTQKVHGEHIYQIEGHLTIKELSKALKQTKNNIYLFIWGLTSLSTLYRSYHDG